MKKMKKKSQLRGFRRLMLEPLERRELLSVSPFSNIQRSGWATTDHFYGNTLINDSETFNNSGSLTYNTATLPANTGVPAYSDAWMSGDYYWGMGLLDKGSDGATINNTGTISSLVSGSGPAQAVGVGSLQQATINNWGTISGTTQNYLSDAEGIWTDSSATTIYNHAGATISASSDFLARAITTQNAVNFVNDGTIEAVCGAGGTVGNVTNRARAACIDTGSNGSPMYYVNNGTMIAKGTSSTTQNCINTFLCWSNGPVTFNNTGFINSQNPGSDGDNRCFYYGAQNQDVTLNNSGTIETNGKNGCGVWFEDDGDRGDIFLNNSGTIQTDSGSDVALLAGRWGPPDSGRLYYSNTGTINNGQIRWYGWPATIYDSGQVHASIYGISGGSDVHIVGSPTIDPDINGGGSDSTLNFNLTGTLQYINGSPANGATSFSGILQGSIVVSGKTYTWSNFGSVSGTVNPDAAVVTGQWVSKDVGTVGAAGSASCSNKVFTVTASGADVGGTADAFRFVDVSTTGNTTLVTRVSSLQNVAGAKAGLMFRDSMDANAMNVFLAVTPDNGVTFQYRSSTGGSTTVTNKTTLNAPCWLKLVRSDNTFTGYSSSDGVTWTPIGSTTVTMAATAYSGLAVTSHNNSALCTATFDNVGAPSWAALQAPTPTGLVATPGTEKVSLSWQPSQNADYYNIKRSTTQNGYYEVVGTSSTPNFTDTRAAGGVQYYYIVTAVNSWGGESAYSASVAAAPKATVPSPWIAQEVGNTAIVGSTTLNNGTFTVSASGNDIWDSSDAFRFTYTSTTSTSFTAVARVASVQNTDSWSKAGLMVRDSLDPVAANAFIALTPGNGLTFQSRTSDGNSTSNATTSGSAPEWVKLAVSATTAAASGGGYTTTTTVTGYSSSDGTNWTQVGSKTLSTWSSDSTPISYYVGLAVTSHNNSALCTATFDNVTVPGWSLTPLVATATDVSSSQINLTWNYQSGATSYNVKRATASGGLYTTIATGLTSTSYTDTTVNLSSGLRYYYVVSAIVNGSETANGPEAAVTFSQLTGAVIGTPGSYNNSGNTIANVFDGDLTTFFDGHNSSNGNGCWAGLDLGGGSGPSSVVTQIKYCPRSGSESRMVGGVFQGANQANFSDAVTLYTVASQPTAGVLTSVSLSNNTAYRYVRYLSPNGGWGNVAEVQFLGYTTPWTPTVVTAAAASPSTVTGTTTALSVLGGPSVNEAGLTYTWATTGTPPAAVSFSANGTNAAKNTTATFTQAGSYTFQVTIANVNGASVTSSVSVTVSQTLTSIAMTPVRAFVVPSNTKQFSATGLDQFGIAMTSQPTFTWSLASGIGGVSSSGLYTALVTTGSASVRAASGSVNGTAPVTVATAPTVATAANSSPVTGTIGALSVLGADATGEANLVYTWTTTGTPPAAVTFSANGSNAAKNTTATFVKAGSYTFQVTIMNANNGLSTTSSVSVTVSQTATSLAISPNAATVALGGQKQFSVTAALDQFGNSCSTPSGITWSVANSSLGSIGATTGLFTASNGNLQGATTVTATAGTASGSATVNVSRLPAPWAWYRFDDGSGATAADSSGNSLSAALSGSYSFASGVNGGALSLTGGYASLPMGIVSSMNNFTIAGWVNLSSLDNWSRIFDFGTSTSNYMFLTPSAGGTNLPRFAITTSGGTNEQQINSSIAIPANTWTFVAVTLSGTTATLYINGAVAGTNTGMTLKPASLGSTNQNYLGKSRYSNDPALNGSLDDFRIYNSALSAANIAALMNLPPTVATAAAASPSPVSGTTTNLSVLGADDGGQASLSYTWSATGPAAVTFSANGSNAAKNTTATFTKAGTYSLGVTIVDTYGQFATSSVSVTVSQTLTSIVVSPSSAALGSHATQQFLATAYDQFGAAMATQPSFTWALASGAGSINTSSGLYTASYASGAATVTAASGNVTSPAASVTITDAAPTVATIAKADNASPDTVAGKTASLSVLGADADGGGELNLTYVWSVTGPTGVSFSSNNSYAAKNTTATFMQAGSYVFTATITDLGGQSTTSSVSVTVNQTLTSIAVSPSSVSLGSDATQQFTATAYDQFGAALSTQPAFTWAVPTGVGSIDPSSGLYTASYASGAATVTASSGSVTSPAANVTVTDAAPTVATLAAASPSTVTGTTYALSVLGADSDGGGEANLSYMWSYSGPASVTFSPNGSNVAKNAIATLSQAGTYTFTVTITDLGGQSTTSSVKVTISSQAQWNAAATASWNTLGSWTDFGATVAAPGVRGMTGDVALFTGAAGGTARLDGANPTLAGITFNNAVTSYTIDPGTGGSLTLQGSGGATVSVLSGNHAISAPVHLASNTTVNAAASSTLTITGPIDGGAGLTMTGGGKLVLNAANNFSGGLVVQSGTVVVNVAGGLPDGCSLTVGSPDAFKSPTVSSAATVPFASPTPRVAAAALVVNPAKAYAPTGPGAKSLSPRAVAAVMAAGLPRKIRNHLQPAVLTGFSGCGPVVATGIEVRDRNREGVIRWN